MNKSKIIVALALATVASAPTAEAIVSPCAQFHEKRPAYCDEKKSYDWASVVASFIMERQLSDEARERWQEVQRIQNMIEFMNFQTLDPRNMSYDEMVRRGLILSYGNVGQSSDLSLRQNTASEQDSVAAINAAPALGKIFPNVGADGSIRKNQEPTDEYVSMRESSGSGKDHVQVSMLQSGETQKAVDDAVALGICPEPKNFSELAECLLASGKTVGGLEKDARTILYAAAMDDPEAKAYLADAAPELYKKFHSSSDDEDIKSLNELANQNLKADELYSHVMEKYQDVEEILGKTKDTLGALSDIRSEIKNDGLGEKTFGYLDNYLDKKEDLLKTIGEKVDPAYREQIKNEIEAAARGNKALSDVLDKKESVEKRINSAGDTLLRQSSSIEEKIGRQTILSRAINDLGNDLKQLGSGDLLNQVGTITKWEREASGLIQLIYSRRNNPVQYASQESSQSTSADKPSQDSPISTSTAGKAAAAGVGVLAMYGILNSGSESLRSFLKKLFSK